METMSFPVGSYLKSETDAVSNIRTHEQLTLTKKGIVGAKLNAVDRVTQCYEAELLLSVQVFSLLLKICTVQAQDLFIKSTTSEDD